MSENSSYFSKTGIAYRSTGADEAHHLVKKSREYEEVLEL